MKKFLPYLGLILLLAGCMVGPKYEPPCIEMPCEWHTENENFAEEFPDNFEWWKQFEDPQLNCLIERALSQNLDLYLGAARILEARREYEGGNSAFFPHIDGSANYGHVGYNKKILNRILCHEKGTGRKNIDFYEYGFDAEWEIDLFGKRRHEKNALRAKAEAAELDYALIQISLLAEIAKNYMELRGFQQHLKRLDQEIYAQNDTLTLSEGLMHGGFASSVDFSQAKEQLSILQSERPEILLSIQKSIHHLAILLGLQPSELYYELEEVKPLPELPCQKPIGVPSDLLRRRPDIRKAERNLAASVEMVGSAVASLFPNFTLRGFIGDIGTFCSGGSFTWFGGSSLLLPLFNSRMLKQDLELSEIKAEEACYEYQKTVLAALEESENAIASFHAELEKNRHLEDAVALSYDAYQQKLDLFKNGFKDYLEVLTTERSFLAEEKAYLESQVALLINYIALYKSLGGCFDVSVLN